ncbi:MAG: hypothetical protein ACM3TR_03250 [Caulobacteraceae bacterium]
MGVLYDYIVLPYYYIGLQPLKKNVLKPSKLGIRCKDVYHI